MNDNELRSNEDALNNLNAIDSQIDSESIKVGMPLRPWQDVLKECEPIEAALNEIAERFHIADGALTIHLKEGKACVYLDVEGITNGLT